MDLEFLGGKYHKPEEIVHGPVQSFRAQNAATGRLVYIHRVSTTEEQGQQSALLLLLASAMTRSAAVKRLVLDVGEEKGFWYIVTELEQQCLALREWLQFEIDNASGNANAGSPASVRNLQPPAPAVGEKQQDAGEFTRMFRRQPMRPNTPVPQSPIAGQPPGSPPIPGSRVQPPPPSAAPLPAPPSAPPTPSTPHAQAGEFARMFQAGPGREDKPQPPFAQQFQHPVIATPPPAEVPKPVEPPKKEPGEFTRMFMAATPAEEAPSAPAPPPAAPLPGPSKSGPGEFTRFFTDGLPPAAPKPSSAPSPPQSQPQTPWSPSVPDRPSDPDLSRTQQMSRMGVQRPNTPPPSAPRQSSDAGEFTRLFSTSPGPSGSPPPAPAFNKSEFGLGNPRLGNAPDLSKPKEELPDIFNLKPEAPMPMPTKAQEQGEYTRLFGKGELPPAPKQSAVAQTPLSPLNKDQLGATKSLSAFTDGPVPTPTHRPSEFTLTTQAQQGSNPGASSGPPSSAPKSSTPSPLKVNLSAPSMPASLPGIHAPNPSGSLGPSGGSFNSPLGSASVAGPKIPPLAASSIQLPKPQIPPAPAPPAALPSNNKKLYILFGILLAAVILLIVVVVVVMAKK